jgi:catechol 2,3-dioxygenase-like lactoylglutathione lyase family enzyme
MNVMNFRMMPFPTSGKLQKLLHVMTLFKTLFCAAILVISMTFACPLQAQKSGTSDIIFNHVALSVSDLDASAEFYMDIFNLREIENAAATEGLRWFSLGQGKELHLISVPDGPVSLNKAVHFALSTLDFDGFIQRLEDRGIEYSSWAGEKGMVTQRADGVRQVYVQDPDGYWIEVNSAGGSASE